MILDNELREIEETIAKCGPTGYEPQLLRIATEYQQLLKEAVDLLEDLCSGWNMRDLAQEFLARLEGENDNES